LGTKSKNKEEILDTSYDDDDAFDAEISEKVDINKNNLIIQHYNSNDENIILCWEKYSKSLPDLVHSIHLFDKNMVEYYRY
jgi:hypothetical protein